MSMEINITDFVTRGETWDFTGSIATHGPNASRLTWDASLEEASATPLLTTEDQLQELRDHVQSMGFGDDVQSYDSIQCNALFIQLISADMRECGLEISDIDSFDWQEYENECEAGQVTGAIFKGCDGNIYYYLGS
jgi:hypothetical protein